MDDKGKLYKKEIEGNSPMGKLLKAKPSTQLSTTKFTRAQELEMEYNTLRGEALKSEMKGNSPMGKLLKAKALKANAQ